MSRRLDRVNGVLRQAISRVLAEEMRDPRLSDVVSVMRVDTSPDLSKAKVYVSVFGDQQAKTSSLKALKSASGFVHRCIRDQVRLRAVPSVEFYLDETIEEGAQLLKLIADVTPDAEAGAESKHD